MIEEEWRPVVGWETSYEVSSHGRLRSVDRLGWMKDGRSRRNKGRVISLRTLPAGYKYATLKENGRERVHYVHRMVAEAFIGELAGDTQVNHKDGTKSNNTVANLELCTPSENRWHSYHVLGNTITSNKLSAIDVFFIYGLIKTGMQNPPIARMFGVSTSCIAHIARGVRWNAVTGLPLRIYAYRKDASLTPVVA